MNRPIMLTCAFLAAAMIAACAPTTPTPQTPTTTIIPSAATVVPTANAKATEAVIIAHVFATMTASAPRVPPTAAATPTQTRRATTAAAQPKTVARTPTSVAAAKATTDPYLAQIPKGMGGILVVNYIGNRDVNFSIAAKVYTTPPNGKTLIVIAPGRYNFSFSVTGAPEGNRSDVIDVPEDRYTTYSATLPNQ